MSSHLPELTEENQELQNLYTSPSIVEVVKSRRTRWAGNMARMGEVRNAYSIWLEDLNVNGHSGKLGVGGRIILEKILGT
jgi:hypothetical protein